MRLWSPEKPNEDDFDKARKIGKSKPIFSLEQIQKWVTPELIRVLRNAETDLEGLEWTEQEVALLIAAMVAGDYIGSEWARAGHGTKWIIDCDVYKVRIDADFARDPSSPAYYIKFSCRESGLLVVGIHLDR
jgi:hypothetical protein